LRGGQGPAEEKTLHLIAANPVQKFQLLLGFNPFGDHAHA